MLYINKKDRLFIIFIINNSILFRKLSKPVARERIKRRLLSINILIPSLETFYKNIKYIIIKAKILKMHFNILLLQRNKIEKKIITLS